MKGPLAALIAATVLVGATFSGGEAFAQKKKIVVEAFKGPAAPKYRIAVMKSLYAAGFDVIPDKTLVKVEADLGLQSVSQSYAGVAKELKLAGFVSGIITGGRRPKARVIVRDTTGKPIGGQIFQATSAPKLMAMVSAGSGPKVASVLGGGGGGAAEAVAAAEPEKEAEAPAEAAAEEPEEKAPPRKRGAKAKAEEEETAEGEGADAEVAAEADDEAPKKKKAGGKSLRVAAVLRTFSRNFAYNQSKQGNQQGYTAPESKFNSLPLVPAPGIAVEFFPTDMIGVFGSYNRGIIGSKDTGGSVYTTSAYSYLVGAKGRLGVASLSIEPSIAYGTHFFKIDNFAKDPTRINVAPVDYKHARIGGDVRIPLASGGSVTVGGAYMHILSAGDILVEKLYFKGTAMGGELGAAWNTPLSKAFDLSIGLDFRRIAFAFTPTKTPMSGRIAGGAVDQYIGLNFSLGYNVGL